MILFAVVFVALLSSYLTGRLAAPASWVYRLDHPNDRSLHAQPTPRTGGIAILTSLGVGLCVVLLTGGGVPEPVRWLLVAAVLVASVSLLDDYLSLSSPLRLGVHVLAASIFVFGTSMAPGGARAASFEVLSLGSAISLVAVVFLSWMTNLYNFMDGMDGFAAGMAIAGFGTLALLSHLGGAPDLALFCMLIVAAAAGFLWHNFPPARIFMGDAGSASLGFLAGGIALVGVRLGVFPLGAALLAFSPFIVDATVTLLRRVAAGEAFWRAHRSHFYQRLVLAGWGHRRTVFAEYLLMLASAAAAVAYTTISDTGRTVLVVGVAGGYTLLAAGVARVERSGSDDGPLAPRAAIPGSGR